MYLHVQYWWILIWWFTSQSPNCQIFNSLPIFSDIRQLTLSANFKEILKISTHVQKNTKECGDEDCEGRGMRIVKGDTYVWGLNWQT